VLINVVGGAEMRMREIQEAASLIQEQAHEDANIIFGASIDESMGDVLKVTVIATGFDKAANEAAAQMAAKAVASLPVERQVACQEAQVVMEAPAPAVARRSSSPSQVAAAGERGASGSGFRERPTFPSTLDTDWDTPAYQRRQSAGS
jgi:cell division protein FtsZ